MRALEEYRILAREALAPTGAFVRLDRADALFVSDAPRKGALSQQARERLRRDFALREEGGLLYLTPLSPDVPERLRTLCVKLYKQSADEKNIEIRKALAECMRLKNAREIAFMKELLSREGRNEP